MTDVQHKELADVLNTVEGMVAFSNYQAPILDRLYPAPKWHKTISPPRTNHSTKDKRVEILWTNYNPKTISRKHANGELFADS
jgi:DNA adenine methylase